VRQSVFLIPTGQEITENLYLSIGRMPQFLTFATRCLTHQADACNAIHQTLWTFMNFSLARLAIAASLLVACNAFAQTAAPTEASSPLTFNLALTSNYKFRGQDQDQSKTRAFKPALNGGFDYAFDNGFYVGNWNSTINWTRYLPATSGDKVEIDVYGGYKFKAGEIDLDVGALTYYYPGASNANTTEVYLGAGYGPVTAKYAYTVSKGYFGFGKAPTLGPDGDGRGTGYFSLGFAQEVMPKTTWKASVGFTNLKSSINNIGAPDFVDYSVGAAYDLGDGFTLNGAIQGANKKASYFYAVDPNKSINKAALIVTLSKTL
jgi:uncharacterized protein (TIGR02001 family)